MRPPERFETERLVLRPATREDAESIFQTFARNPEVTRYTTWRPHTSVAQTLEFLVGCEQALQGDRRFPYVITIKGSDSAIGLFEIRVEGYKVEIGYGLGKAYWGKGYITEAARTIIVWALSQPSIYRVWAECDVDNIGSWRVMEKAGMRREGILKRNILHPGISNEPRDSYIYAIVK